jgi:hypothetical protein
MISGQTISAEPVEDGFFSVQNSVEAMQNMETVETAAETNAAEIDADLFRPDLSAKFTRLKKSMRKRSVSIF